MTTPPSASTRHSAAVDQALGAVVAQADQPVAGDRQRLREAVEVADALVVGAPRPVDADQHLVGGQHLRRVDRGAADDAALAVGAVLQVAAGADDLATGG